MAIRFKKTPVNLPSAQGFLLFLLPFPVFLAALKSLLAGDIMGLAANALGSGLYLLGALTARRGLLNAADYDRRKIALAPKYPLKTLGGLFIALATGCTAYLSVHYNLAIAVCFGLIALLGYYFVYGLDPRTEKRVADAFGIDTTAQVVEALTSAEKTIAAIEQANRAIRNSELNTRLDRITALARQILGVIENDPKDIRRARKFLNVYLEGAQQVTQGYAQVHRNSASQDLEDNFRRVLVTIEDVFKEQHQKLLEHDALDLDVQIEVLATQLKREGVV